jgi:hypothetical protein
MTHHERYKRDQVGCINDWGTKNEGYNFQGLQGLNFCLFYIIIAVVDFCMPIDKMMSC